MITEECIEPSGMLCNAIIKVEDESKDEIIENGEFNHSYGNSADEECLDEPTRTSSIQMLTEELTAPIEMTFITEDTENCNSQHIKKEINFETSTKSTEIKKRPRGRPRSLFKKSISIAEAQRRKRGRPRSKPKCTINGFEDIEIIRFIFAYKKFPQPFTRLESIARYARLEDKSFNDLQRLGALLYNGCRDISDEFEARKKNISGEDSLEHYEGTFQLSGVTVKALDVLEWERKLEPLALCMPLDPAERIKFRMTTLCKPVVWPVAWNVDDDSMLLQGVYEYGFGSWEAIKKDPRFMLAQKIGNLNKGPPPLAIHLRYRVDYLLNMLAKQQQKQKKFGQMPRARS